MLEAVPCIDLSPIRSHDTEIKNNLARIADAACCDIGFLVVTGHGVPADLTTEMTGVSRAFFDLPLADKLEVRQPSANLPRGYSPLLAETVSRSRGESAPGDLNESLMIGPVRHPLADYAEAPEAWNHFAPNIWPAKPFALERVWTAYYRAMEVLADDIMRLFALALGRDELYFRDKIDRHVSRLRVRNYPALTAAPAAGQLRAGAHSDYGSLTILKTEDKPGGLQVLNKSDQWMDVPFVPDSYVINIGELMARWTNNRWVSTLHRVVNPPVDATDSRRQSIVYFHNPNYDTVLAAMDDGAGHSTTRETDALTAGEHLRLQFQKTQNENKRAGTVKG